MLNGKWVRRFGRAVRRNNILAFTLPLGTDISGLLMIRIMILCVFILDYVVVIRLIARGGESAVDFQTEASPGSGPWARLCLERGAFQPGVWREKRWIWILMKASWACVCSFCQIMSRGVWGHSRLAFASFPAKITSSSLPPSSFESTDETDCCRRAFCPLRLFCARWRKVPRAVTANIPQLGSILSLSSVCRLIPQWLSSNLIKIVYSAISLSVRIKEECNFSIITVFINI